MKVVKDGRVWSAYDKDFGLCLCGDTKVEAAANLTKAMVLLGNFNKASRLTEGLRIYYE